MKRTIQIKMLNLAYFVFESYIWCSNPEEYKHENRNNIRTNSEIKMEDVNEDHIVRQSPPDHMSEINKFDDSQIKVDNLMTEENETQTIDKKYDFSEILKYFDSYKIDIKNIAIYSISMVDVLLMIERIWNKNSITDDNDIEDDLDEFDIQTCCHGEHMLKNFDYRKSNFSNFSLKGLSDYFFKNLTKVDYLIDYLIHEYNNICGNDFFLKHFSIFLIRSELCREMLASEYKSFFHFNLRLLSTKLLLNESKTYIKNILTEKNKKFMANKSFSILEKRYSNIEFTIKYIIPFFEVIIFEVLHIINMHFTASGSNFEKMITEIHSENPNLKQLSEMTTFSVLIESIQQLELQNKSSDIIKHYSKTCFFQFSLYIATRKVLKFFTENLITDLTPFCNCLEAINEELNEKSIIYDQYYQKNKNKC